MFIIKRFLAGVLLVSAYIMPAHAAQRYMLDPNHTQITWHASHMGFSFPTGKFIVVAGSVVLDEEKPEMSTVEATIVTSGISTGIEKFDTHLKSPDFFDVERFPSAIFKSESVQMTGEHTANVKGTLTLLGISKPVTLEVTLNKLDIMPMVQKKVAGFSAKTVLKRSDFGMKYALPMVGDDVAITIEAEARVEDK